MTFVKLIVRNLVHYLKANFWVAMGVAISTAVLTGGLIVGDSVKHTLQQSVLYRLGDISHTVTAGERFFTSELANKLCNKDITASAALKLEGIASVDGGQLKLNSINVWGIDNRFFAVSDCDTFPSGTAISENLANRLNLSVGDEFMLRINKGSLLPLNAPFVSDENQTITTRLTVQTILNREQLGRLSLQNTQTAPFNVFLPIEELNNLSEMKGMANILFISSEKSEEEIALAIQENWTMNDAGLMVVDVAATGEWELRSQRVFMDETIEKLVANIEVEATPILTYFANRIQYNQQETPYSFVSSLPDTVLEKGQVVINQWLANDLNVKIGDSVALFYYNVGTLRELTEVSKKFKVVAIEPLKGFFADQFLMPAIPGLSDAANCRDWQTGVPVNLKSIRDKDEDYWYRYRGVPKAFISYSEAKALWSNRFGSSTAFRFKQSLISNDELTKALTDQMNAFDFDLKLNNTKAQGFAAAKNGTDFSSLFLGLSFFILVAGLLLTSLMFVFSIEKRQSEIGTLSALGFKNATLMKLFLVEGGIVSAAGALLGLLLAIGYNELVFIGLNKAWNDIIRTDLLISNYRPTTFLIGWFASTFVSIISIGLVLKRAFKRSIVSLQRKQSEKKSRLRTTLKQLLAISVTVSALIILAIQLINSGNIQPTSFFIAGGMLLVSFLLATDLFLSSKTKDRVGKITLPQLVLRNLRQSKSRSLIVIVLLGIATFLVVSTGLNRQNILSKAQNKTSGTGGFLFWAETTVPLLHNLNSNNYRSENGFTVPFSAVQMSVTQGDDASCLNLNKIENPRIIGVDANQLIGRFSFQTFANGVDKENTWLVLKEKQGECFPAIADQTVIQWSLGKKIGDTLQYKNSAGKFFKLKLVAGTLPSVFQGYVVVDQSCFVENFPTASGSNLFLIDGLEQNKEDISDELKLNFRDMGIELVETAERLALFKSVENTYLSIFLALGALGLLIGTVGLAVVLQRSVLERKSEFALLKSIGFQQKTIVLIVVFEYAILLLGGVVGGLLCAIIAVVPALAGVVSTASVLFVLLLIVVILFNGLSWIIAIATYQLNHLPINQSLRAE